MNEQEWLDKENGTTEALRGPQMSDTDRNIMRDLAGEADEPCYFCEEPMRPQPRNGNPYSYHYEFEDYYDEDHEIPCHTDCLNDAYEAHLEDRAEAQKEARLSGSSLWRWA